MSNLVTAPGLEVAFADFLDDWKARWRYEPRYPTEECETCGSPQFRVWLPRMHSARRKLGRAFYVQIGAFGGDCSVARRELPVYRVCFEDGAGSDAGSDAESEDGAVMFCAADGRVCLRASWRAE